LAGTISKTHLAGTFILAGTFWRDFFFTIQELYVQNAPFLNKGSETQP